jgi:hypothetical protein
MFRVALKLTDIQIGVPQRVIRVRFTSTSFFITFMTIDFRAVKIL